MLPRICAINYSTYDGKQRLDDVRNRKGVMAESVVRDAAVVPVRRYGLRGEVSPTVSGVQALKGPLLDLLVCGGDKAEVEPYGHPQLTSIAFLPNG